MLETGKDMDLQSCEIVQTFVWWGASCAPSCSQLAPHHTNVCKISVSALHQKLKKLWKGLYVLIQAYPVDENVSCYKTI